jgi:phage-related protein
MAIGFTIPASESYVAADTLITPDKGMTKKSTSRVRVAKFGDGYEQRIADGINNVDEQYSVSFSNREKSVIDDIAAFFESRKAASFNFTIPDSNAGGNETTVKVVVAGYSLNYDNHPVTYSISTTLRRVYEA